MEAQQLLMQAKKQQSEQGGPRRESFMRRSKKLSFDDVAMKLKLTHFKTHLQCPIRLCKAWQKRIRIISSIL
jgi:hypothetical protein